MTRFFTSPKAVEFEAVPVILGVTGSIGGGKSTVSKILAQEHEAIVLDADQIAGEATRDPTVLDQIRDAFGKGVILEKDGRLELDRPALAAEVFASPDKLRQLESIIHPQVRRRIESEIERHREEKLIVLDVPLLFEAGLWERCDHTWMVDADRELRLKRVSQRGWDDSELTRRERNQWPIDRKRESADLIIDNGGSITELKKRVHTAIGPVLK